MEFMSDTDVGSPPRHLLEDVALAGRQRLERVVCVTCTQQFLYERGIDDRFSPEEIVESGNKVAQSGDSLLQEISDPASVREKLDRVLHLQMRGQDEDVHMRKTLANPAGGIYPLRGVCWWHADVDDHQITVGASELELELNRIADGTDNIES